MKDIAKKTVIWVSDHPPVMLGLLPTILFASVLVGGYLAGVWSAWAFLWLILNVLLMCCE